MSPAELTPPNPPLPGRAAGRKRASGSRVGIQARAQALEHDLRVHQVELEMQHDELRRTEQDLAATRDGFVDLYDFAPVGYLTLDNEGVVVETNLTAAILLGGPRKSLVDHRFARFVAAADRDGWHRFCLNALRLDGPQRIEISVQPLHGATLHIRLDCVRVIPASGQPLLRIALTDITQRKRAEIDRQIATAALDAREAERRRVARELHEELGQRLSAVKMELSSLRPTPKQPARGQRIAEMIESLDTAVAMVRRIAIDLRPPMLDDLGLHAAIEWLAHDSSRRLGLHMTVSVDEIDPPLDERTSIAVFRLFQDALSHIARTAGATRLHVELRSHEHELVLRLDDNGIGAVESLNADAPTHGAVDGAIALRQQALHLGGALTIETLPVKGHRVTLQVPTKRISDTTRLAGPPPSP